MEDVKSSPTPLVAPDRFPTVGLRDLVFFPAMVLPLILGRARSVAALEEATAGGADGRILLLAQRDGGPDEPSAGDLHRVGTVARVVKATRLEDETFRVVFEGIERVRVQRFLPGPGPFRTDVVPLSYPDRSDDRAGSEVTAVVRRAQRSFRDYVHIHPDLPPDLAAGLPEIESPERIAHWIAGHLLIGAAEKQAQLEAPTLEAAFRDLLEILDRELEILQIEDDLDREMREKIDDDRRKHYLQEHLKAIQRELGEGPTEWGDLETQLEALSLPTAARERADKELERLKHMSPIAPKAGVIRAYLDCIAALPWSERTDDNAAIPHAKAVLEGAHFGLEEVKDRILDHIAVLSLVGQLKGPILYLVGPPGVGKTSLGQSIAQALDRRFVRVALGGVRDEAEIRGHRRTYVGSLPGQILQGMRRAGSRNPVFLLDEVDKLARDGLGDPYAALLEVLDPEQNRTFQDHYLELEFDLSDVLFVATANTLSGISDPLRDRMEVIRIPGYLDTEKRAIAKDFLIPEQLGRHGLSAKEVRIPPSAIDEIIAYYTREAGVRELDRMLARVARKMARRVAEGGEAERTRVDLRAEDLGELLGPRRHYHTSPEEGLDRVGMATGLAWTVAGGEVLEVEVSAVPGSGAIQLTGTLGDVMKESAVAAVTFSRARARELGLRTHFHQDLDLHIHIPEGATPKDGRSAGITIAAALISALIGTPTRRQVAMTGEITLRGRVLPVGGIKEKAVAAMRNGVRTVILPAGNADELALLPAEVLDQISFQPVERMEQVLDFALSIPPGLGSSADSLTKERSLGPLDSGTRVL